MHKENIKKLKKYLFLISVLFIVLTSSHLFYIYLQEEAKETPIEGGVVSEGILGDISKIKLNPLMFGKNPKDDYIMSFLYRGLLTYNPEKKELDSDLAKCDLSDLTEIKCILEDNLKWSDGTNITAEDVLATYKMIKKEQEKLNLGEYLYLKNTEISLDTEKNIIFKYNKIDGDINFIPKVLFQPIVSKAVLEGIGTRELFGKFNSDNGIFSGEYIYDGIVEEENGIIKMKLKKNPYYNGKKSYILKYNFKFSQDLNLLIQNVNIFNNKDGLIAKKGRFREYEYNSANFLSLFINVDKITDKDFRKFIFSNINRENIIKLVNEQKNIIPVKNPFFMDNYSLDSNINNFDLAQVLKDKGYQKKSEILQDFLLSDKKEEEKKDELEKVGFKNENLKYIVSNEINKKYNFISQEVIINGKLNGEKAKNVIIKHNDREILLNSFKKSGGKSFVFGLKEDFNTLEEGKNNYEVYFDDTSKKENLKEKFVVYYSKDREKLKKIRDDVLNSKEIKQEKEKQKDKQKTVLQEMQQLDDRFFYNKENRAFSLKMYYIEQDDKQDNFIVTKDIIDSLEKVGIKVEASPIKLIDLKKKIDAGEKDYDIILAPFDLGYFKFNISGYFHSGYAKKGFNLSNLRDPALDVELLELNKQILEENERKKKQEKILKILKEKQVIKTLYSVKNSKFVDKMISNYKNFEDVPSYLYTKYGLINSYIKSKKEIDFDKKSFFGYLSFLKKILFGEYEEVPKNIIKNKNV